MSNMNNKCISIIRIGPLLASLPLLSDEDPRCDEKVADMDSNVVEQYKSNDDKDDTAVAAPATATDDDDENQYISTANDLRTAIVEYFTATTATQPQVPARSTSDDASNIQSPSNNTSSNYNNNNNTNNNNNLPNHQIIITNRYFSAPVRLVGIDDATCNLESSSNSNSTSTTTSSDINYVDDGVILIYTNSSYSINNNQTFNASDFCSTMDRLHRIVVGTNDNTAPYKAGELLRLCISVENGSSIDRSSKEYEVEYSKRVLWCLDNGYEYIEMNNFHKSTSALFVGHDVRDKDGFPRLIEAMSGTVWSSATMFPKQQQQLQQSFLQIRNSIQQHEPSASSTSFVSSNDNNTHVMSNQQYIPPSLPINDINLDEDKERERKAQEALLKECGPVVDGVDATTSNDNDNDNISMSNSNKDTTIQQQKQQQQQEERQQEQLFQSLESAINEARTIRDMSMSNQFTSDQERRNRAANIAMQLLNIMNLDDTDNDDDDEDGEIDT